MPEIDHHVIRWMLRECNGVRLSTHGLQQLLPPKGVGGGQNPGAPEHPDSVPRDAHGPPRVDPYQDQPRSDTHKTEQHRTVNIINYHSYLSQSLIKPLQSDKWRWAPMPTKSILRDKPLGYANLPKGKHENNLN